jgi:methyl-accepting chemotaxis protein
MKQKKKSNFNYKRMMLMYALIPVFVVAFSLYYTSTSLMKKEIDNLSSQSMSTLINGIGSGIDESIETFESIIKTYATAPNIIDALLNPNDKDKLNLAQEYTVNFYSELDGWEGLYLASWETQVLTHSSNPDIIGKVLRSGDELESLHTSMATSKGGLYNAGIITSPSSGELTVSMYYPIYYNGKPIGYVGGGTLFNKVIERYDDTSVLELESSYLYAVDKTGLMLYHKDDSRLGTPVENEAVKELIKRINAGEHPEVDCVTYNYKGVEKRASYYVGNDDAYIVLVTADESDVMATMRSLQIISISVTTFLILSSIVLAIYFSNKVTKPLNIIVNELKNISDGDLSREFKVKSKLKETSDIIATIRKMKDTLTKIANNLNSSTEQLTDSMNTVTMSVDLCSDASVNITTAIEEISGSTQNMAESVTSISSEIRDMSDNIDETTKLVYNAQKQADSIVSISRESQDRLKKLIEANDDTTSSANNVIETIVETNKAIERVTAAAKSIKDIAEQTNLLSLNASIEAARAGDAGRGFAVVASEIGKLANNSASSSSEIQNIINDITLLSHKSAESAKRIGEAVEHENEALKAVGNSFTEVITNVGDITNSVINISDRMASVEKENTSIADDVYTLSAIAEENAAATEETNATIEEFVANIDSINSQVYAVNDISGKLGELAKSFKI